MLFESNILAFWLYNNPDVKLYTDDGILCYWYSSGNRCFMYHYCKSEIDFGPKKAFGLCSYYWDYVKSNNLVNDDVDFYDLFDISVTESADFPPC